MQRLALAALLAATLPAHAQVYKCPGPNGVTYQAQPCAGAGGKVDLQVHQPTEADRLRAQARSLREKAFNLQSDAERLAAERRARAHGEEVQAEKDRKAAQCQDYDAEIKRLESTKDRWISPALRQQDYDRIDELKDRRFSECR